MTRRTTSALVALVAAVALTLMSAGFALASDHRVALCHATGSETNPYVLIVIAPQAVENAHMDRETGNLHGDHLGNQDYYATEAEIAQGFCGEAEASPTPEPTPTATPTPTPTPTEEETPSPTPTPTPTTEAQTPTPTPTSTALHATPEAASVAPGPLMVPNTAMETGTDLATVLGILMILAAVAVSAHLTARRR